LKQLKKQLQFIVVLLEIIADQLLEFLHRGFRNEYIRLVVIQRDEFAHLRTAEY
jgi:hypothetical protein